MTILVGVLCREGVVLGCDSSATFVAGQLRTIEQPCDKLSIIQRKIVVAGSGQIGLGQRFCKILDDAWNNKFFTGDAVTVAKRLCEQTMKDFSSTAAARGTYGALVAFFVGGSHHLCEFQELDFQPELKVDPIWFCSMGSAQPIADPFLALMREIYWPVGQPSLQDGIFAATWALDHAVEVNPGGVNKPIRIGVLQKSEKGDYAASELTVDELSLHRESIDEAKKTLKDLRRSQESLEPQMNAPEAPKRK